MGRKSIIVSLVLILSSCAWHIQRKEIIQGEYPGYPLKAKVEIIRDQFGIPHIRAENDEDLFFGLGYAMAQDRFFQLDLLRRAGRGELCQLFGRYRLGKYDLLGADKLMRALNYKGRAEQGYKTLPPEAKKLLDAFTRGINRYLAEAGDTIPQYHFFRTKPEKWHPWDSFVCADVFGLTMTAFSFADEYYYGKFFQLFGPEKAKIFLPSYPKEAPIVVQDLPVAYQNPVMEKVIKLLGEILQLSSGLGSNNWVVSRKKSASGEPIIANDPHVPSILLPTFWYHCHLQGGSFNVAGMMFPGFPAFGGASNAKIAWALTNACADHIDLFIEKLNPQNPNQYLYRGKWQEFKIRKELIPRKRKKPIPFQVKESVHGPIIDSELLGYSPGGLKQNQVYAIKLVDVNFGNFLQGYLDMARASNWKEFKAGLKNMSQGPVAWNHIYADLNGNIGYWLSGHIPIRPDNQGYIPRPGWSGEYDWKGYVPFQELPHLYNPKKGYIATANNRNYPEGYPYYIGIHYRLERILRIDQVLRSKEKFSVEDMKKLQLDVKAMEAEKIVPILIQDLAGAEDKKCQKALSALKDWQKQGYFATTDSIGTGVYMLIRSNLIKLTFKDELGKSYSGASFGGTLEIALKNILEDKTSPWFDNIQTQEKETRTELVRESARQAVKYLEKKLGKNPEKWQWGKLQHSYFYTPAGFIPLFGKRHRIGKYPREGIDGTVNNSESIFLAPLGYIFFGGPTTRMIVDFSQPEHILFNTTTGNSENIKSGRMGNLTEYWVKGEYLTLSLEPEEYEKKAMGKLVLKP